jgi:hypothetical protein
MKQTAVDLFCTTIADHIEAVFNGSIQLDEFEKRMRQSYGQAKEMEKEQIKEAFKHGQLPRWFVNVDAEQYYTQTFTEPKKD